MKERKVGLFQCWAVLLLENWKEIEKCWRVLFCVVWQIWHREVTRKEKRQSYGATLLNSGLKPIYIHLRIDGCSSFNIWNIQMYLKTSFESFGKSSHHYPIYLPVTLFVFHFVRIFSIFNTSSFTYGRNSFYIVRFYCKPTSSWTSTSGPRLNLPLDSRF
jgi:hypothetical protein